MTWLTLDYTYTIVGWIIRVAMIGVVLRRSLAPGASVAWLGIVFLHPYIGLLLYGLLGESSMKPRQIDRYRAIIAQIRDPQRNSQRRNRLSLPEIAPAARTMVVQAEKISGLPVVANNTVLFFPDAAKFIDGLIQDINAAQRHVNLLYYIFACDDPAHRVSAALCAAAKRGVTCRLLVDAMASREFLHNHTIPKELSDAGVHIQAALPVAPLRGRFARMDLRNHRKLAIIDDDIAWAGSHNLIDPSYGGRRGNPWVDLTARFTGPIVAELALVFAEDWTFDRDEEVVVDPPDPQGQPAVAPAISGVAAQVVPTAPTMRGMNYRRLLLAAITSAQSKLVITTPYFVPDEPMLLALLMAADRGVEVKLILPQKPDHFFAAAAGRAHFQRLLDGGITIHLFQPGLIHAKTATVDDTFSIFGSANMDIRSFELNFELSILLYGPPVTEQIRQIQTDYLSKSVALTPQQWQQRPQIKLYADRAVSLLSPLL